MTPFKNDLFYPRMSLVFGLVLGAFVLLVARLYYLQMHQKDHYKTLSDKNRIHLTPLKPTRGRIFDRKGIVLADNKKSYHALVDRRKVKDFQGLLEKLSSLLSLTEEDVQFFLEQAEEIPRYIPLDIKKHLTWEEVSALQVHTVDLPGVDVVETEERVYPFGEQMSHVIGYVGKPSKEAVQENVLLSLPGVMQGKNGLERFYEESLRGTFGQVETENNARGQQIRVLSRISAERGVDLTLTLDAGLQAHIYNLLQEHKSATAVVLDAETGAIYAMVSVPSYDSNAFIGGISSRDWNALLSAENAPLINKAIAGLYSPGSLIKVFLSVAVLADPRIGAQFTVDCNGRYPVSGHIFHCWKRMGHGGLSLSQALVESCDVFFYKVSEILGIQKLVDVLKAFHFGFRSGVDLPQEKNGLVPSPEWKKKQGRGRWFPGDTINLSIGQGDLLTTPLQWASAMATLSNGGKPVRPHFYQSAEDAFQEDDRFDQNSLKKIQKALEKTVNSTHGTGRHAQVDIPGFRVAGKTSTSQVRRITREERVAGIRSVEETPWHLRDNAMFVGYAPAHKPKYVVALMVEHGGWGGRTTGPLVKNIFNYLYKNLYKYDVQKKT